MISYTIKITFWYWISPQSAMRDLCSEHLILSLTYIVKLMSPMHSSYVRKKIQPRKWSISHGWENQMRQFPIVQMRRPVWKTVQVMSVIFPMSWWRHGHAFRTNVMAGWCLKRVANEEFSFISAWINCRKIVELPMNWDVNVTSLC